MSSIVYIHDRIIRWRAKLCVKCSPVQSSFRIRRRVKTEILTALQGANQRPAERIRRARTR
jgi:hypothetical protein